MALVPAWKPDYKWTVIGPQPSEPIRSGRLDKRTETVEMAAEQRLRKISTYMCVCVCVMDCMDIIEYIYFEAFSFPHCEQALLHTYASCPNMHCFSLAIICSRFNVCAIHFQ